VEPPEAEGCASHVAPENSRSQLREARVDAEVGLYGLATEEIETLKMAGKVAMKRK
jgi:hypothetical protein